MKVLIVPSWYPTKYNEVYGSFFKEQAEALASQGVDVFVFAISSVSIKDLIKHWFKYKLFSLEEIFENNVKTYRITICSFGLNKLNIYYKLYEYLFKKYYKKVSEKIGKIDIVHAHSFKYAGYICCKHIKNIPIVITEHIDNILKNNLIRADVEKLKYSIENSVKFICVSKYLKDCLLKIVGFNSKTIVIPNIVNNIFHYRHCDNINGDRFLFCTVSALYKSKGVDMLIKAFYKAFQNDKNVYLKIAGSGPEGKLLNDMIKKLYLTNRVTLLGQIGRISVAKLYNESHAFAMASKTETFGLVYAESLMSGLPTIGTHNGGADDILDCYGGYLCEVDNIDDISNKMIDVYNNYKTIDRERIYLEAASRFSEDKVAKRIIDVYKEVIQ